MNLFAFLAATPRCASCGGAGYRPYRTCAGRDVRVPCACLAPAPTGSQEPHLFTGAAATAPRVWPPHVREDHDSAGAIFVECCAPRCLRPSRIQFATTPGRVVFAGPALDEVWRLALPHAGCGAA